LEGVRFDQTELHVDDHLNRMQKALEEELDSRNEEIGEIVEG